MIARLSFQPCGQVRIPVAILPIVPPRNTAILRKHNSNAIFGVNNIPCFQARNLFVYRSLDLQNAA